MTPVTILFLWKGDDSLPADKDDELLEVFDQNGLSTGAFLPRGEVHKKKLFHQEVSLCVINEKDEILLEKRNKNKKANPSKWSLVGGHVTKGETLEEAIKKEAFEEVGIHFDSVTLFDQRKNQESHSFKNRFYTFTDKKIEEYNVQKEEVDEVIYMNFGNFLELIKKKENKTVYNYNEDGEIFLKLKEIIERRKIK